MSPHKDKIRRTKNWLLQPEEARADCSLADEITQRNEPTYSWDEVVQRSGLDKYHLRFRTRRLKKKHRLELNAT